VAEAGRAQERQRRVLALDCRLVQLVPVRDAVERRDVVVVGAALVQQLGVGRARRAGERGLDRRQGLFGAVHVEDVDAR